jgi:ABC-type glycerol-3-phosphate transport system permease component
MKLFLSIYFLGSFISLFMTNILLKIKKNKIEEAIEESEEMMPDDFKLKNAKEIMTQDMILLSSFTSSWITVFIILFSLSLGVFNRLISFFKIK